VLGSRRVTQLLEHLSEAVEQSSLFDPRHPGLEEELVSLRRRLEALSSSEPGSVETPFSGRAGGLHPACPPLPVPAGTAVPCDVSPAGAVLRPHRWPAPLTPLPCSLPGSGFTLAWAAKDRGELHRFLTQNLSLPNSTAELLLGSSVDLREVGDGSQEVGGDPQGVGDGPQEVGDGPLGVGGDPREVGGDPQEVGDGPQGVGDGPGEVGGDPQEVGGGPQEVGGDPWEVGDDPQGVDDGPGEVGDGPGEVGDGPRGVGGGPQEVGDGPPGAGDGPRGVGDGPWEMGDDP